MSRFKTTRWSLVAAAAGLTAETRKALSELCELYWPPVYSFVRRTGRDAQDALDLTQGFFAEILEHNDLATVDPDRGRFRSWLLGAVKHYMANQWRAGQAQKRGGGAVILSIDAAAAEGRYADEPVDPVTPERVYLRRWALTVLDRVLARLETELAADGKQARFERLKGFLVGEEVSYDTLAEELGEAAGTLRVAVHRMRRRYRDLLRQEIADTVESADEVDDEIRQLLAALA